MTRAARVAAQAKINVWLHVGELGGSGYHEIFTLFQRVDLSDEVLVRALDRPGGSLTWTSRTTRLPRLGVPQANLAYRAAEAYQLAAAWPTGFEIELEKRIPVGGGLGGGSADAGAVLRALNAICPNPLPMTRLLGIGASVGSDVPFLTSEDVRAVGTGRGERLMPFEGRLSAAPVLLVMPPFGISTPEAYRWIDALGPRTLDITGTPGWRPRDYAWPDVDLGNHFEAAVETRHPVLGEIRNSLKRAGAAIARLSGSGSTVLGIFPDGLPDTAGLATDALMVNTRTSESVVPVEVLE